MTFDSVANNLMTKGVEPARWLLIAGIAYTLATTIWTFFATPAPAPVSEPAQVSESRSKATGNVNWILGKHLFGEAGAAPEVAVAEAPAQETRLPLELQSVFVADVQEESSAIIAQRGKSGLLYRIGANIPGNAKLVEVLVDRVVLSRAGARETLKFPKKQFSAQIAEPGNSTVDGDGGGAAIDAAGTAAAPPSSPADALDQYRERLQNDAEGTLDELGIETAESGGYRLGSNAQSAYLQQTGLQPGDVIMSVNGRQVGNIEQDQLELENILAQGSARIEVQRGGRRFFITVSLK